MCTIETANAAHSLSLHSLTHSLARSLALLAVFVCRERPTYVIKCTVHYYYHYYTYFGLLVAHIMITYYFHCDFDSTYKTFVRNMGDFFYYGISQFQNSGWLQFEELKYEKSSSSANEKVSELSGIDVRSHKVYLKR